MAKYNLSLSSREDLSKKRQVLVRATFGKNFRMRFKSGVWVNPVNFDDEANEIIIPKKGRLNFMERAEATQAKSRLSVRAVQSVPPDGAGAFWPGFLA